MTDPTLVLRAALYGVLIAVGAASATEAAPDCYTQPEIEAAEAIRFHTDLMIGSLTCRTQVRDRDPYEQYKGFTRKHERVLARYERSLINRFARLSSSEDPVARFDRYRTELANALGREARQAPLVPYCAEHLTLLDAWEPLDSAALEDYVRRRRTLEGARYQLCPQGWG